MLFFYDSKLNQKSSLNAILDFSPFSLLKKKVCDELLSEDLDVSGPSAVGVVMEPV